MHVACDNYYIIYNHAAHTLMPIANPLHVT